MLSDAVPRKAILSTAIWQLLGSDLNLEFMALRYGLISCPETPLLVLLFDRILRHSSHKPNIYFVGLARILLYL